MSVPAICTAELGRRFGKVQALDDISLEAGLIADPARLALLPVVGLAALVLADVGAVALLLGRFTRPRLVTR